ncbi:MAG: hypothetical protein K0S12_2302, partial [Bacteroidetes bacterium]|nr:hypothetical protein [Bacteroidota bacterium]
MNLLKNTALFFVLSTPLMAQKNAQLSPALLQTVPASVSNIIGVNTFDSTLIKVELKNAQYDASKGNMPYYLVSRKTAYNQTATPKLIIKKTLLVTEKHAAVIKKYFNTRLSAGFEIESVPSLSRGENLNHHKLFPLRLNAMNQVEELVDYDFSWEITPNSNRQLLSQTSSFKSNSVLQSGTWYKIGLTKTGIYKMDKAFLASLGIDVNNLDPRKIRVYGNGGKAVPEANNAFRYDDLEENAIFVSGESDGVFNDNDYVLFFGSDVNKWVRPVNSTPMKFLRQKNHYSDSSFYFINTDLGTGKRMITQNSSSAPSNVSTSTYDYYNFHEVDLINFIKSGRQFFGEYFDINTTYNFGWTDGSFVTNDSIVSEVVIAGRGSTPTLFSITGNGMNGTLSTAGVNINSYLDPYADVQTLTLTAMNTNPSNISLTITKQTPSNIGWLDFITVNARRNLNAAKQFHFRDLRVKGTGNICNYTIANPSNGALHLWNITDPINPYIQLYNSGSGSIDFKAASDSLIEYVVSPANDFFVPKFIGKVGNQNLHAVQQADYVIIAHPLFTSYAQRMAALHQQQEGLSYVIATTDQIYNEFGSGKQDAAAIRDFIRMLYTRNLATSKQPKYVLLMGDGSYDNKNRNLLTNSNYIPTYESPLSLSLLQSTATDDFYGLMDPSEGFGAENIGAVDIGVGRFMGRTTAEIAAIVNKCENYYRKDPDFKISDSNIENCTTASESPLGDWRNWLIFMGDDEDQATHMQQANSLSGMIQTNYPIYNHDKIYLDAYQRFSTPGGHRYPDVTLDLNKRIKKGALVFNYTGHGGEVGLTAERVVDIEIINNWDNINRLPLFITATCEFSRYDDPGRSSAGEYCLTNPKGGSIALMTTCRLAFSSTNFQLNQILLNYLFKKLPNGKMPA